MSLHIITPLFRYNLINKVSESIPKKEDIIWHIAKTSRREKINIETSDNIKIYEIDCDDSNIIKKRNTIFENINDGYFHLLDDDTIFLEEMYNVYKTYSEQNFIGMVIGKQKRKNGLIRLIERLPLNCHIDTGNVLCHSSILKSVKWKDDLTVKPHNRDFIFWRDCHNTFKNTILVPNVISVYNFLI